MSDAAEAAGATRHAQDLCALPASSSGDVKKCNSPHENAQAAIAAQVEFLTGSPADIAARLYHAEREKAERERSSAIEALRQRQQNPAGKPASTPDNAPDAAEASEGASTPGGEAGDAREEAKPKTKKEIEEKKRELRRVAKEAEKAAREAARAKLEAKYSSARDTCGAPHMGMGEAPDAAAELERLIIIKTGTRHANDQSALWHYSSASGTWQELDADALYNRVQRDWHATATVDTPWGIRPWKCKGWAAIIEAFRARAAEGGHGKGFFAGASPGLAFTDCFLEYRERGEWGSRVKGPQWRARHGFDFPMPDIGATTLTGRWADFLALSVPEPTGQALLGEMLGVALLGRATVLEKALLLIGPGGTGKSTFLKVAKAIVGATGVRATASIQPQHWHNGHYLAGLVGVRLNACTELNRDDLGDTEVFKAMTSGDDRQANPKGLPNFQFVAEAAHFFAANTGKLPQVTSPDPAFWNRWVCVPFDTVVRGTDRQLPDLAKSIVNDKAELARVVGWALRLGIAALERNSYTQHAPGEAVIAEWSSEANPVVVWLKERTTLNNGAKTHGTPPREAYANYVAWCERNGHRPLAKMELRKRLRAEGIREDKSGEVRWAFRLNPLSDDDDLGAGKSFNEWRFGTTDKA